MTNNITYVIKDSQGRYEGHIDISSDSVNKPYQWKWVYVSQTYPMSGSTIKYNAELKLQKLRELNSLAGYDYLDWEIIELTDEERFASLRKQHAENELLGRDQRLTNHYNISVKWRDIPSKLTATREAVNDIYKKYKSMVKKLVA